MHDDFSSDETVAGPPPGSSSSLPSDAQLTLGNYRLVERIGEGGMGEVYIADQFKPIQRRVALKIIKQGMDTAEFIDRFESERQALALMDHPYIARVYDAGATDRGRPYLVMEYVPGVPITRHCNDQGLGIRARLELFIKVCEGIQHAHQKAIIHRDIKPSNVLVTSRNDQVWPKVIDFGVAKALGQKLTEHTIQTAMGQILGTPEYMSPEQADLAENRIDTRTDIYLLGVLLYVLLTDLLPFDPKELRSLGLHGMLHKIRAVDPPRPSVRLAAVGDQAAAIAAARGTTAAKLVGRLRGDLDWITMMALEKEPDKRYQAVQALIDDINHYLRNEPVAAGAPTTTYRIHKFVKRHRAEVIAAAMVLSALVLGLGGTIYGLVESTRAEARAVREAETARQVSDFLVGLFQVVDPSEALGNTITAREILDEGVAKIERELTDQPEIRAHLMNTMGKVYKELGLYTEARPLLEQSLATMEELQTDNDLEAAVVMDDLGGLLRRAGSYDAAYNVLTRALEIRERELGPEDPDVAQSLNSLGNLFWEMGRTEDADDCYQRALRIREATLNPLDPEIAITLNNLGGLRLEAADYAGARPYFERALAIREASLGENHPDLAFSLENLGNLYWQSGDAAHALAYYERCLRIREKVLDADHPLVGQTLNNYGLALDDLGEYAAARAAYERALEIYAKKLDPDHAHIADTLNNLANLKIVLGDASAVQDAERAVAIREKIFGPEDPAVAEALTTAGVAMMTAYDYAGARERFERAIAIDEVSGGGDSLELANNLANLGLALSGLNEYEGARGHLERALAMRERLLGPNHLLVAESCYKLGAVMRDLGDFAAGKRYLDRSLAIREAALGPDDVATASSVAAIGLLLYYEGKVDEARKLYTRALEVQIRKLPTGNPDLMESCYNLACLHALAGNTADALRHLRLAVDNGLASPYVAEDGDLAALHGNPEFDELLARILARANAAGQ